MTKEKQQVKTSNGLEVIEYLRKTIPRFQREMAYEECICTSGQVQVRRTKEKEKAK